MRRGNCLPQHPGNVHEAAYLSEGCARTQRRILSALIRDRKGDFQ